MPITTIRDLDEGIAALILDFEEHTPNFIIGVMVKRTDGELEVSSLFIPAPSLSFKSTVSIARTKVTRK